MLPDMNPLLSYLESLFPLELAEDWDNVGFLLGDPRRAVRNVLTCLTITPEVVAEAVEKQVDVIVSHHPFPFHAVKRITTETPTGKRLLQQVWTTPPEFGKLNRVKNYIG